MTNRLSAPEDTPSWVRRYLIALLGLSLAVSGVPSPLYARYQGDFHAGPMMTTVVFAGYALGALLAIMASGPLLARVPSRHLLIAASMGMVLGCALFMGAQSPTWLVCARCLHGASVGLAVVVAGAELARVAPERSAANGLASAIAFSVGMGAAAVIVGFLVSDAPWPLHLPWLVTASRCLVFSLGAWKLPQYPVPSTSSRIALPSIPAAIRSEVVFAALGVSASWATLGLLLSVFPGLMSKSTHLSTPLAGAAIIGSFCACSALAQAATATRSTQTTALAGDALLATGVILGIPALETGHAFAVVATTCLIGMGYGAAFGGSLRHLVQATSRVPQKRAEVMSAYYLIAYAALAIPTLGMGFALQRFSSIPAYATFACGITALALVAIVEGTTQVRRTDGGAAR